MAEIVLNSNASSSLFASSKAAAGADESSYTYSTLQSGVNKFTEKFIRSPINNAKFGSNSSVNVPQFGILREMVIHTQIKYNISTAAQTPVIAKALFAQLIDQVSLKNSSRELQVIYGDTIRHSVYSLGDERSKKWRLLGHDDLFITDVNGMNNTAAGAYRPRGINRVVGTAVGEHTLDVYTVLPFSMFPGFGSNEETPFKNLFNTRFIETISLDVKFADRIKVLNASAANGASKGFAVEPTINTAELICKFDIIENNSLKAIEAANYAISTPLAMVLGNYSRVTSSFIATATTAQPKVQLFDTSLAHSILVTVKKVSNKTQYMGLSQAINIPSCNIAATHENDGIAKNMCAANAQFTEGYGATVGANRRTLNHTLAGGGNNLADGSIQMLVRALGLPMPATNKHCIPNDCAITLTAANDGIALVLTQTDAGKAAGLGTSRPGDDLMSVQGLKLTSAGRTLYETKNDLESLLMGNSMLDGGKWYSQASGHCGELSDMNNMNGCSRFNIYEIVFGDHGTNLDAIRGCLSMKNLNSLELVLDLKDLLADSTYEISIYVKKYSALSISASDGRISTSVST